MAYLRRRQPNPFDPCVDVCGPSCFMVSTLICSYIAMAICIPWLLFWMALRGIVWVLTCGHYGFNDMAKKQESGKAERLAAIKNLAQLGEFLNQRTHPGNDNPRNDVDLEAQRNVQPAASSKMYHEAQAEIQRNRPHADDDAIELEAIHAIGRDTMTSEEKEEAAAEARRLKKEKEAEEEAQNRENIWVWQEDKPAKKDRH